MKIDETIGKVVKHEKFGEGVIVEKVNDGRIFVEFVSGRKLFLFPQAFEDGFLRFSDENLQKEIDHIKEIKKQKIDIIAKSTPIAPVASQPLMAMDDNNPRQKKIDLFWHCFDEVLNEIDNPFMYNAKLGKIQKQFAAINSCKGAWRAYSLSVEVFSRSSYLEVFIYVENDKHFFNQYFYDRKTEIENKLKEYRVDWELESKANAKRLLTKVPFELNKMDEDYYKKVIRQTIPVVKAYVNMIYSSVPRNEISKFFDFR